MSLDRTQFNTLVDDDGSNTVGTLWTKAKIQSVIIDPTDGRWSEQTVSLTGTQNDVNFQQADTIRASNASSLTINGLLAPTSPAKPGKPIRIVSVGAGVVILANEAAASTAANRLITGTGASVTLAAGTGWAILVYDDVSDRWRLLASSAGASSAPSVVSSTVTGAQNNYAPTLATQTLIEWNGAADATFTGLAGGVTGRIVTFKNVSGFIATFAHNSGSSSAGNKFRNIATSAPTPIAAAGFITYQYDGTDWMMLGHDQGAWITTAFNAANFNGGGSMTWTLGAGDVTQCKWRLKGTELLLAFSLITTTVGGTPTVDLRINNGAYGGFSVNGAQYLVPYTYKDNGGAFSQGFMQAGSALGAATFIGIYKAGAAAWSASTNLTDVYGSIAFEVA